MEKSFKTMISRFEKLPHIGIKCTMKNGSTINMRNFHVHDDTVFNQSGNTANISDIDFIEIDSE